MRAHTCTHHPNMHTHMHLLHVGHWGVICFVQPEREAGIVYEYSHISVVGGKS